MSLSVCLIVRNEEDVLPRCLGCVKKFADEIIIVDTGSNDGTVNAAHKYTDKIYSFEWCYDFSAARNFSLSKATSDYVMWLDADDVVSDADCRKIREIIVSPEFDMAFFKYSCATQEGDVLVYYRERVFRRDKGFMFSGAVHEAVMPCGKLEYFDITVTHKKQKVSDKFRNLDIYRRQISSGKALDARGKFYYGRELLFNGMYRESIAVLEDFMAGDGWVENKIEACINLAEGYGAIGDGARAEASVLRSFLYAPPRSRACCMLGDKFLAEGNYKTAIYWYTAAISADNEVKNGGFFNPDFSGFVPLMQLCVAYDRLGDFKKARECNEAAGKIKPLHPSFLANKRYFEENKKV